uniref:N-alpha-acetyltransferase 80 n=1 Tax=Neogobius melanostomus TaxID=47308 RepID=A0A8C6SCF1_9GOBI
FGCILASSHCKSCATPLQQVSPSTPPPVFLPLPLFGAVQRTHAAVTLYAMHTCSCEFLWFLFIFMGSEDIKIPSLRAVPIHQRPDLLGACADLVNSEWKRSRAARVHSLQKSSSEFPVCLVLLQGQKTESEKVIGHSRLSRVVGKSNSLFVESVVVSESERGKGYGRALMEETERYAKTRGFKRLYLTTHDKQHFYSHIGYVLSTPVQNAGALATFNCMPKVTPSATLCCPSSASTSLFKCPPPPPLPASSPKPPACPAPPPPPPLSSPSPKAVVQTLTETPYRDAKGMPIFWMHKDV